MMGWLAGSRCMCYVLLSTQLTVVRLVMKETIEHEQQSYERDNRRDMASSTGNSSSSSGLPAVEVSSSVIDH